MGRAGHCWRAVEMPPGSRLMAFDTTTVPPGRYPMRLLTVMQDGNYPEPCTIAIDVVDSDRYHFTVFIPRILSKREEVDPWVKVATNMLSFSVVQHN